MPIGCKRCGNDCVKNGIVRGKQRYYCKGCQYNFIEGDERKTRWHNANTKRIALILYLEGMGFRGIERVLSQIDKKASNVAIINWIKSFGESIISIRKAENSKLSVSTMEFDEMWHFIKKNGQSVGSGLLLIEKDMNPLISFWDLEEKVLEKSFGKK
jgi:transposase-like protein